MSKTNIYATQFCEENFDNGIIIRITLEWMAPVHTQSSLGLDLRPVQHDCG